MCERLKQSVLKTDIPERVSGVRIPLPPPDTGENMISAPLSVRRKLLRDDVATMRTSNTYSSGRRVILVAEAMISWRHTAAPRTMGNSKLIVRIDQDKMSSWGLT